MSINHNRVSGNGVFHLKTEKDPLNYLKFNHSKYSLGSNRIVKRTKPINTFFETIR